VAHDRRATYRDHHVSSYLAFESNCWSRYGSGGELTCTDSLTSAAYSTNGVYLLRPRHRPAKRRFAALELPGEDTERDALVVQFLQANVTTEIFHVDAIVREQGIVS